MSSESDYSMAPFRIDDPADDQHDRHLFLSFTGVHRDLHRHCFSLTISKAQATSKMSSNESSGVTPELHWVSIRDEGNVHVIRNEKHESSRFNLNLNLSHVQIS